jgi:hypothetical protein
MLKEILIWRLFLKGAWSLAQIFYGLSFSNFSGLWRLSISLDSDTIVSCGVYNLNQLSDKLEDPNQFNLFDFFFKFNFMSFKMDHLKIKPFYLSLFILFHTSVILQNMLCSCIFLIIIHFIFHFSLCTCFNRHYIYIYILPPFLFMCPFWIVTAN